MAQVPYTGAPQVAPQFSPTPSINVSPPPSAFGAATAEATQRLGGTMSKVGDELFSRAIALQQLDQQAAASNAVADFTTKLGERYEQFRSLQGKAAVDGYQPYIADVNNLRESVGNGLESDYARKLYLQESRNIQARTVFSAAAHAGDQNRHYLIGTEEATAKAAINSAALDPTNENAFQDSIGKLDSSANMMSTLHGWSPAQRDDYVNTKKSELVFERATTLARTDPVAAQKVLDSAVKSGYVSADVAGRAGQFIRNQRNTVTSRVESASLLAGEGYKFGEGKISTDRAKEAIGQIEAGGNYNPPHPDVTHIVNGQKITEHALGRYGIMQSNLQPWLKEAGMPSMSEAEFLTDHAAQDKLFAFKFGQLQDKYGSANKAANAWFTGSPELDPNANDGHTSGPGYLKKFNAALAKSASAGDIDTISRDRAKELIPNDIEFEQGFRDKVLTEHNRDRQITKEDEFNRKQMIESAIVPARDGKLVTSIDDIQDPAIHDAWNQLSPSDRARYQAIFARNSRGDYAPTPENQAAYHQWLGRLIDPTTSDEDRRKALDADYASMAMPANQRQQLVNLRAKVFSNTEKNPTLGRAMQVLAPMLNDAGISKKSPEDYYNFVGSLHLVMEQQMKDSGKPLKDEDIRTIGAGLLREQSQPWLFGMLSAKTPSYRMPVPDNEREKIISAYKSAKGFDPTDQIIQQIYAAHQFNQFYAKQKSAPEVPR